MSDYTPPRVWQSVSNGGKFAEINRPTAGERFEHSLPIGEHPLQLYSLATPNGVKVILLLEELLEAGIDAEYDAWPIDISSGEQFGSDFVAINPNSKIPALLDRSVNPAQPLFESGSILLQLSTKFSAFVPKEPTAKAACINWLFWGIGAAPFLGGGFGHFYAYAPEKFEYPIDRYTMEVKRQLDLLDQHLSEHEFIAGSEYSIADMAIWPWYGALVLGELYEAAEFLQVDNYRHVLRWAGQINARPAAKRAVRVNKTWGDKALRVPERHSAADFDS
jgi:GST-like protein